MEHEIRVKLYFPSSVRGSARSLFGRPESNSEVLFPFGSLLVRDQSLFLKQTHDAIDLRMIERVLLANLLLGCTSQVVFKERFDIDSYSGSFGYHDSPQGPVTYC